LEFENMTRNVSIISAAFAHKIQFCVSTEQKRYYPNGFTVEAHPIEGAYLVATDGHRMGIFRDAAAKVAKSKDIVQLPKDFLKACKAKSSSPLFVYIDHDAKSAYLARSMEGAELPDDLAKLPGCAAVALNVLIDGNFPDWRRACPPDITDDEIRVTGFSAKLLGEFGAVSDVKGAPIQVYSKDPLSPAWVFVSGVDEFLGVIMPMRCGSVPSLPSWLNATPAAAPSAIAAE
jgi:hypothetical protein